MEELSDFSLTIGGEPTYCLLGSPAPGNAQAFEYALAFALKILGVAGIKDSPSVSQRQLPTPSWKIDIDLIKGKQKDGSSLFNKRTDISSCVLSIIPDVDVIEVNLPVCYNLSEISAILALLNLSADKVGLSTGHFSRHGRFVGTRGGCHITLSLSGFGTRRVQALVHLAASLLVLFHKYSCLSYMFCGDRSGPDGYHPGLRDLYPDSNERLKALCAAAADLVLGVK